MSIYWTARKSVTRVIHKDHWDIALSCPQCTRNNKGLNNCMQRKIIEMLWYLHDVLKTKEMKEYILLKHVDAKVL